MNLVCLRRSARRYLFLGLSLLCCGTLWADDFERGMAALEQGYTRRAIELWKPLAELDHAEAQFGLGVIYNDAMGIPQDYVEANYWFLRAAQQGFVPAQYNLGNAYKHGTGLPQDHAMAVIWWRKAAEADFGPAQYNLGSALLEGSGVPRDRSAGLDWYRRAAANGHPLAKDYLDNQPGPEQAAPPAPSSAAPRDTEPPAASLTTPRPSTGDAPSEASQDGLDCAAWLNQSPDSTYSIQLLAARAAASARAFSRNLDLQPAPVLCAYPSRGGTWHAVLYGQFASAAAARQALAALPKDLRDGGAYLRRLQELREALASKPAP